MQQFRRTRYVFFYQHDSVFPDIGLLLRGSIELRTTKQLYAISMLQGEEHPVTLEDIAQLSDIPSDRWVVLPANGENLDRFTRRGILLSDAEGAPFDEFRRRDAALSSTDWNIYAALYHAMKKWSRVRTDYGLEPGSQPDTDRGAPAFRLYGEPPSHFLAIEQPLAVRPLESPIKRGTLYSALRKRKTSRSYDSDTPMQERDLATILHYVFGCHGLHSQDEIRILKKTSPSGGGLHPIEVYPLVRDVWGVPSGLYHYGTKNHALELMMSLTPDQVSTTAGAFAVEQPCAREAHVLFVLTARFQRSFWKYRKHEKAYSVILMDAGHLSQTLYLVCADLGLGAFVSAAINDREIEEKLGIDGYGEGAIAVLGCGVATRHQSRDPEFVPDMPPSCGGA